MSRTNNWILIIWLVLVTIIKPQTNNYREIIQFHDEVSIYMLENNFISPNSVVIKLKDNFIYPDSIDYLNGTIYLKNNFKKPIKASVTYKYFNVNAPLVVGPKWKTLPQLNINDSINYIFKNKLQHIEQKTYLEKDIFTSGTFNRQININTQGISEFTGGLHLNINGNLDDNISLSAVLSDQNIGIQPEGNTRNLEDLEQVYITLRHPVFSIEAGDIQYNSNIDKYININRNLIGVNNNFIINDLSGNILIGSSKGKHMILEIKGNDGIQGPYDLISINQSKDISLISGSEKVWLDGDLLIRGKNYDYVIDYGLGKITFTPKNLIHFDSDIFIEYEYYDGRFSKDIISGSFKKNITQNLIMTSGVLREKDNVNDISNDFQQNQNGDALISGAVEDSLGDYYLLNEIFIYDPDKDQKYSKRYSVTFSYDPEGIYERKISELGKVYYNYVLNSDNNNGFLFSPYQVFDSPELIDIVYAKGDYNVGKNLKISGILSLSGRDQNLFDNSNSHKIGSVYEIRSDLDSLNIGRYKFGLSGFNSFRQKNYNSPGLDREVRFKRHWNLDSLGINNEKEASLKLYLLSQYNKSNIQLSSLNVGPNNKKRITFDHGITYGILKDSKLLHRQVSSKFGLYQYTNADIKFNILNISPFLHYKKEGVTAERSYENFGGGISYIKKGNNLKIGIDNRKDKDLGLRISNDLIGVIDYKTKYNQGWRKNVIIQKRIKTIDNDFTDLNYLLGRIRFTFKEKNAPLEYGLNLSSERNQTESFSVVYDSLGVGLGDYRFDKNFNTFVSDPNGAYISSIIPTGYINNSLSLRGNQRFIYHSREIYKNVNIQSRFETSFDYSGNSLNSMNILSPTLSDLIFRSYLHNLFDIDIRNHVSKNRAKLYSIYSHNLEGYDPRGKELSMNSDSGVEFFNYLNNQITIQMKSTYHKKSIDSGFSELRNRSLIGSQYNLGIILSQLFNMQSEISIKYVNEEGEYFQNKFNASSIGLNYDGKIFFAQNGSINANISWVDNKEKSGLSILPPEALNGKTLGQNINSSFMLNYFFKEDISLSLSLSYLNNSRYNKMINFLGEIRAYL